MRAFWLTVVQTQNSGRGCSNPKFWAQCNPECECGLPPACTAPALGDACVAVRQILFRPIVCCFVPGLVPGACRLHRRPWA